MRKYLRCIARYNMHKAGIKKINKKMANGKSIFSTCWRQCAIPRWIGNGKEVIVNEVVEN